jgi:2'-hydroxyisoflavone reductase
MLARTPGTFNADSAPRMWTMGSLVDTLVERRTSSEAPPVTPRWIDEAKLIEQRVTPWTELPLWIPATDVASAGFMEFSSARAFAQGLRIRPLWQTIDDTAMWLATRAPDYTWRNVLSADKERALLAAA